MINETRVRCFLTLAETLNFTETAKLLYMTQQGVSKHIAKVEEEMGFPLFIRSHRSVSLTAEGERCYEIFSHFMEEYEDFLAGARSGHSRQVKTLRVGYQNWLDFGPAPGRALEALREVIPELELTGERYSPGALRQRLLSGKLDLILIHKRFAPKAAGLKYVELNRTRMMVMVARGNPLNHPDATYQTFAQELFLIDAFENESPTSSVLRARQELQSYGLNPSRVLVLPNRDSVYTAAELGQGIIVGSAMAQVLTSGTLVAYPTDTEEALICMWQAGEKGRVAERYAKLLQQEYRKLEQETEQEG